MIRRNKHKVKVEESEGERMCSNLIGILHDSLREYNYDLSDQACKCFINQIIMLKARLIKLEVFMAPLSGVYEGIEFRPTLYYKAYEPWTPPKIFNDRKIFHPNINVFTSQISVPDLADWNPSLSCIYVLRRLKYVIIQPNTLSIPNNPINRKAGFLYIISREKLRQAVLENCPSFLQQQIALLGSSSDEDQPAIQQPQMVNLKTFYPIFRAVKTESEREEDNSAVELDLLCKNVRKVYIDDDQSQIQEESDCMLDC